jgi:hypothetical protein
MALRAIRSTVTLVAIGAATLLVLSFKKAQQAQNRLKQVVAPRG